MQRFDEMYSQASATQPGSPVRAHYQAYAEWLAGQSDISMLARREEAEMIFRRVGITFAVYGDKEAEHQVLTDSDQLLKLFESM